MVRCLRRLLDFAHDVRLRLIALEFDLAALYGGCPFWYGGHSEAMENDVHCRWELSFIDSMLVQPSVFCIHGARLCALLYMSRISPTCTVFAMSSECCLFTIVILVSCVNGNMKPMGSSQRNCEAAVIWYCVLCGSNLECMLLERFICSRTVTLFLRAWLVFVQVCNAIRMNSIRSMNYDVQ